MKITNLTYQEQLKIADSKRISKRIKELDQQIRNDVFNLKYIQQRQEISDDRLIEWKRSLLRNNHQLLYLQLLQLGQSNQPLKNRLYHFHQIQAHHRNLKTKPLSNWIYQIYPQPEFMKLVTEKKIVKLFRTLTKDDVAMALYRVLLTELDEYQPDDYIVVDNNGAYSKAKSQDLDDVLQYQIEHFDH